MSARFPRGSHVAVDQLNDATWNQFYIDPDEVQQMAGHALAQARAFHDSLGEAHALVNQALFEARVGTLAAAARLADQASGLLVGVGDQQGLWLLEHVRALTLWRQGRPKEALASQHNLERVSSAGRAIEHRIATLHMLTLIHSALGQSDEAMRYGYKALAASKQCGSKVLQAVSCSNLAMLHFDLDNLEEAKDFSQQAFDLAAEACSPYMSAGSAGNLIFCCCALGLHAQALNLVDLALRSRRSEGWRKFVPFNHVIALCYLDSGRLEDARHFLDLELGEGLWGTMKMRERAWIEARLCLAEGRFRQALDIGVAHTSETPSEPFFKAYDEWKLYQSMAAASEALADFAGALNYLRKAREAREQIARNVARAHQVALQINRELAEARHESELAIAAERQRIMREIHDGIGSCLIMSLARIEQGRLDAVDSAKALRDCIDELTLGVDSTARSEGDLPTLIATLRYRLEGRLAEAGTSIRWAVGDLPALEWLDARHCLSVLRILQEALTNVMKHARASRVDVEAAEKIENGVEGLQIRIGDDGIGFIPSKKIRLGHGLRNMTERAEALGGRLGVDSRRGSTVIRLWLPLHPDAAH